MVQAYHLCFFLLWKTSFHGIWEETKYSTFLSIFIFIYYPAEFRSKNLMCFKHVEPIPPFWIAFAPQNHIHGIPSEGLLRPRPRPWEPSDRRFEALGHQTCLLLGPNLPVGGGDGDVYVLYKDPSNVPWIMGSRKLIWVEARTMKLYDQNVDWLRIMQKGKDLISQVKEIERNRLSHQPLAVYWPLKIFHSVFQNIYVLVQCPPLKMIKGKTKLGCQVKSWSLQEVELVTPSWVRAGNHYQAFILSCFFSG